MLFLAFGNHGELLAQSACTAGFQAQVTCFCVPDPYTSKVQYGVTRQYFNSRDPSHTSEHFWTLSAIQIHTRIVAFAPNFLLVYSKAPDLNNKKPHYIRVYFIHPGSTEWAQKASLNFRDFRGLAHVWHWRPYFIPCLPKTRTDRRAWGLLCWTDLLPPGPCLQPEQDGVWGWLQAAVHVMVWPRSLQQQGQLWSQLKPSLGTRLTILPPVCQSQQTALSF